MSLRKWGEVDKQCQMGGSRALAMHHNKSDVLKRGHRNTLPKNQQNWRPDAETQTTYKQFRGEARPSKVPD